MHRAIIFPILSRELASRGRGSAAGSCRGISRIRRGKARFSPGGIARPVEIFEEHTRVADHFLGQHASSSPRPETGERRAIPDWWELPEEYRVTHLVPPARGKEMEILSRERNVIPLRFPIVGCTAFGLIVTESNRLPSPNTGLPSAVQEKTVVSRPPIATLIPLHSSLTGGFEIGLGVHGVLAGSGMQEAGRRWKRERAKVTCRPGTWIG
jgi:hypothetical protein